MTRSIVREAGATPRAPREQGTKVQAPAPSAGHHRGRGATFPATLSLLTNVFTERRERARAIGLWGASTGIGIAVGPIVGGWLLEHFSWTSIFYALVPVAALALALVAVVVPSSRDPDAPPR
jgi:MFS family permease